MTSFKDVKDKFKEVNTIMVGYATFYDQLAVMVKNLDVEKKLSSNDLLHLSKEILNDPLFFELMDSHISTYLLKKDEELNIKSNKEEEK